MTAVPDTAPTNEEPEPAAMRRARLVVAYDGSGFHGFAEADAQPTVLGTLREAMERVLRVPLALTGAGRTDAGVHAWGQVVSGDLPATADLDNLRNRLNKLCGPAIAVRSVEWTADPEFDARFSALWRHYRYDVWNAPFAVPTLAGRVWHLREPLQLWAMQLACDPLLGEHDFSSFCRKPKVAEGHTPPSMRRRVIQARWHEVPTDWAPPPVRGSGTERPVDGGLAQPGLLRFEIRANAFCHQMVRSIVGTLVDVGLGRLHAGDLMGILHARSRVEAGQVAPPDGLTLWDVGYPDGV